MFHLMPYRELPADFEERYRSVWVDPPSELYDPVKGHQMYHDYLTQLQFAAAQGMDGVCVNEHHSNAYGLMPSPNLMASILARTTKDAAIVVLGNSLALYNPPIRVAEEMAMLDVLSGGRLVAGFPVGTSMDTNFCYGVPPAILREKYYEAHDLVMAAWTRPEVFAWNGKYNQLRYVNTWPKPIQKPHPPIWIPGGGSVETWAWCAKNSYNYSYLNFYGYLRGKKTLDGFWSKVAELGVEPNPYLGGFAQGVAVADTDAMAKELYEEHVQYFYRKCLHVYQGFAEAPGYRTLKTWQYGSAPQLGDKATQYWKEFGWDEFLKSGMIVGGSVDRVCTTLTQAAKDLRVGHMMVGLQFGSAPHDLTMYNIKTFTEKVMPEVRHLWDDEWEDRWWIQPDPSLAQRGVAENG
jgi:alkanesulfonate monooxygenase SsuD/methylene tetrahydromethanopterin reductase-like flavin-dependent oxidoreductase (luciferase family)